MIMYIFHGAGLLGFFGLIYCAIKVAIIRPEAGPLSRTLAVGAGLIMGGIGMAFFCGLMYIVILQSLCFRDCPSSRLDRLPSPAAFIIIQSSAIAGLILSTVLCGRAGAWCLKERLPEEVVRTAGLSVAFIAMLSYYAWIVIKDIY